MPHRPPEPFNCPNCGTKYALVRIEAPSTPTVDLTGLFWTKLCEKLSLERSFGDAEEEVQRGADCDAASSDRSVDVTRESGAGGMPGGRDFAAELLSLAEGIRRPRSGSGEADEGAGARECPSQAPGCRSVA